MIDAGRANHAIAEAGEDVCIRVEGRAGRITLNRPKALNALTWQMVLAIDAALKEWADDDKVCLVVIDAAGERAFCAGGDILKLYQEGQVRNYAYGRRFWADEYRMNARIAHFPKPFVALMDGIAMGGGVGVSVHASHRVVTDRATVAMPECSIGLVPDVGVSLVLARAPGHVGEYLGLTGARMTAGDAIFAGFADVLVPSGALSSLIDQLCEHGDTEAVRTAAVAPGDPALAADKSDIDRLFSFATLGEIEGALESDGGALAARSLRELRKASPLSAAVHLDIVRAVRRDPTIETALRNEFRFTWRSQEEGEFQEGVRAAVVDKDRSPRWQIDRNVAPLAAKVARMRSSLGDDELTFN